MGKLTPRSCHICHPKSTTSWSTATSHPGFGATFGTWLTGTPGTVAFELFSALVDLIWLFLAFPIFIFYFLQCPFLLGDFPFLVGGITFSWCEFKCTNLLFHGAFFLFVRMFNPSSLVDSHPTLRHRTTSSARRVLLPRRCGISQGDFTTKAQGICPPNKAGNSVQSSKQWVECPNDPMMTQWTQGSTQLVVV